MAPAVTDGAALLHIRLVSAALPENTVQHMLMFMEKLRGSTRLDPSRLRYACGTCLDDRGPVPGRGEN